MSSSPLISLPPAPATPAGLVLPGDGWWPDIDANAAREACRLPDYVTDARLLASLEGAVLTVTADLAEWAAQLLGAGAANLGAVTAAQLVSLMVPDHRPTHRRPISPCAPFHRQRPRYTPAQAMWLCAPAGSASRLSALYLRAVRFAAMAEVSDQYRDMATITPKQPRVEAIEETGADYYRWSVEARRDMLGQTRVAVELI